MSYSVGYKHFKDRGALLAAVAIRDLTMLTTAFVSIRESPSGPMDKLKRALETFIDYGHEHPSRYRLLLSSPVIAEQGVTLRRPLSDLSLNSRPSFRSASPHRISRTRRTLRLRASCMSPCTDFIDIEAGGRMRREKGLTSVQESVDLLIDLLSQGGAGHREQRTLREPT